MNHHAAHCLGALGCISVRGIVDDDAWTCLEWIVRVRTGYAVAGTFWVSPN